MIRAAIVGIGRWGRTLVGGVQGKSEAIRFTAGHNRTRANAEAFCAEQGIAWVPYFPLGSAFDRVPSVTDDPVVIANAQRLHITPAQAGLAWLLGHSPATLLIPGTRSLVHLAENVAVARIALDRAAMAAFDALARPTPAATPSAR